MRPRGLKDMRHEAAWMFGAVCPARDTGVALVMPEATPKTMQMLLDEMAAAVPADRHAVLIMDGAGWHTAHRLTWPSNITPLRLPAYSPALNPIDRVWLYLRERYLSHRLFNNYDAIPGRLLRSLERPARRHQAHHQPRRTVVTSQSFKEV